MKRICDNCKYYRGSLLYFFRIGDCIVNKDVKKRVTCNHTCYDNFERYDKD